MPLLPRELPTMSLLNTADRHLRSPGPPHARANHQARLRRPVDEHQRGIELDAASANTRASSIVNTVPLPSSLAPGASTL
jgi:hypothetical protein